MKILAIKGHATRGKEVIEILEMLGGKNRFYYDGTFKELIYTIGSELELDVFNINSPNVKNDYIVFTLEQFIEKFPYKVGDKVNVYDYESEVRIDDMKWDGREIQYQVFTDETEWYSAAELMEINCNDNYIYKVGDIVSTIYSDSNHKILNAFWNETEKEYEYVLRGEENTYFSNELKPYKQNINMENKEIIPTLDGKKMGGGYISYVIPEGYTYDGFNSLGEIILKPNKIQYPTNYEECCDVLRMPKDESYIDIDVPLSYNKVLTAFTQLLICRDAYWKIFGEEMKLGKPWEPDFNDNTDKYFICYVRDEVWMSYIKDCNKVLVFPTEEMRNIFYENFKKEIEICKKLI